MIFAKVRIFEGRIELMDLEENDCMTFTFNLIF